MSHYGYLVHSELYHHGIKGMKWGIRRYQNKDGTLTSEGKRRYGTVENLKADRKRKLKRAALAAGGSLAVAGLIGGGALLYKKTAGKGPSNKQIKKRIDNSLKDDFDYDNTNPNSDTWKIKYQDAINRKDIKTLNKLQKGLEWQAAQEKTYTSKSVLNAIKEADDVINKSKSFRNAINSKDDFTKFKFAKDNGLSDSVKDYMINQDDYGNKKKTLKFD